ncbi:murein transglycosylase A [bacterium]|nr:murein transglycosylase A [bacterium]MBU1994536.1 murein transglycosylase A [bacterium]
MKSIIYIFIILVSFWGCSIEPKIGKVENIADKNISTQRVSAAKILFDDLPKTYLLKNEFEQLPNWEQENYLFALNSFIESCRSKNTQILYKDLCEEAKYTPDAKEFLQNRFKPYLINTEDGNDKGLLTGYYEPRLRGSLTKKESYIYPIYKTPDDLIVVDLGSIYPKLKDYRLRGRLEGNKLVPYYTRKETKSSHINADVICYTDSKIDRFFLEIQGSGRVELDNGETIFIGYANQNGHAYRAIGKYLVLQNEMKIEDVSLQNIKAWLYKNPSRIDEVLNYNKSVVYFKQKEHSATGSLGIRLTAKRSIAVDRRYIPLGSMLYLNASFKEREMNSIVLAQDTGGAIVGAIRADLFLGYGEEAMHIAGELKAPLKLWILLPKETSNI